MTAKDEGVATLGITLLESWCSLLASVLMLHPGSFSFRIQAVKSVHGELVEPSVAWTGILRQAQDEGMKAKDEGITTLGVTLQASRCSILWPEDPTQRKGLY